MNEKNNGNFTSHLLIFIVVLAMTTIICAGFVIHITYDVNNIFIKKVDCDTATKNIRLLVSDSNTNETKWHKTEIPCKRGE